MKELEASFRFQKNRGDEAEARLADLGKQWDALTHLLIAAEGDDLVQVVATIIRQRDAAEARLADAEQRLQQKAILEGAIGADAAWTVAKAAQDEADHLKQRLAVRTAALHSTELQQFHADKLISKIKEPYSESAGSWLEWYQGLQRAIAEYDEALAASYVEGGGVSS